MARRGRELDEDDVRVRPARRGSRPRTKDRPAHRDAVTGRVIGVDRGRYTVLVDGRLVTAMTARELGRARVVVGDAVAVVGDVSGDRDALARVVRVHPRTSVLRRTADDTDPVERVIVANADQLVVVTAVADPTPRPRMVDRCLVAAFDAGLTPLLVLTKTDLADPAGFQAAYAALDLPAIGVTVRGPGAAAGISLLQAQLADRVSVLIGHSGVGKSTLVNSLVPGAGRLTGEVNDATGRGRHTSSSAVALQLPGGGWVIDTPGLRSFGLAHVSLDRVVEHFPELVPGTAECPRACSHDEPECALDAYVAGGAAGPGGPARLDSLRRLLRARSGGPD